MVGGFKALFTLTASQERESVTFLVVVQSLSAPSPRAAASQQTIFVLKRDPDYTPPLLSSPNWFAPSTFVLSAKSINDRVGVCWGFFVLWVGDVYVEYCTAKNFPCRGLQ